MKINNLKKPLYSAYILTDASRNQLLEVFTPAYDKIIAHHITVQFGNITENDIPKDAKIEIVGYKDSGDGLQALVASVDGNFSRPDGSIYHITWSLDPSKYKPVDSNKILKQGWDKIDTPISISTIPKIIYS